MIRDLGEIKVSSMATAKDWEGYPAGCEAHSATNHPAFVREVLERLAFTLAGGEDDTLPMVVWDPQAGTGTTMREGRRVLRHPFWRFIGWDIEPRWRDLWNGEFEAVCTPERNSVGIIVTSPIYPGLKPRGRTERQAAIQASMGSTAGTSMGEDLPDGHLALAKTVATWTLMARPVMERCFEALSPGGLIAWIVKDFAVQNQPAGFVELNQRMLELVGFEPLGGFWRPTRANGNAQLRQVLWDEHVEERRPDPGQGNLFGEGPAPDPEMLVIDREWALVGRVPDFDAMAAEIPW